MFGKPTLKENPQFYYKIVINAPIVRKIFGDN